MKNWLTTIFGLAAGGLQLAAGGLDWKHVLLAVATAAIGVVAKDYNTTGAGSTAVKQ